MLTSQEFLAQVQDFYRRNEIDVASQPNGQNWLDRQDAHSPVPECMGGTETVPLRKDAHILYDLLVSEEVGKCVFYGHAKELVETLPEELEDEITSYFQWLYEKWAGANTKGTQVYRDPETGETARLTREEALFLGWEAINKGKGLYKCPTTGKAEMLTREDAEKRGWVAYVTGTAAFIDLETGEIARLPSETARELGMVGSTAGQGIYRDPVSGKCEMLTKAEAEKRGLQGSLAGLAIVKNPETGKFVALPKAEAEELGWEKPSEGHAVYKNPETGETVYMSKAEATALGWVGFNAGRVHEEATCPHCQTSGRGGAMKRYHFDNCKEREGSWRWFVAQMKELA